MHKCLKCGRIAQSLSEISEGCSCGSKVFVFQRLDDGAGPSASGRITLIPDLLEKNASPPRVSVESAKNGETSSSPLSDSATLPPPPPPSDSPVSPPPLSDPSRDSPSADPRVTLKKETGQPPALPADSEPLPRLSPAVASAPISDSEEEMPDPSRPYSEVWLSKGGAVKPAEAGAPIRSMGDAVSSLAQAEVANVRQLKSGVYEIDVGRLKGEPLVIQDSDGVYYVRLPFVPLADTLPLPATGKK